MQLQNAVTRMSRDQLTWADNNTWTKPSQLPCVFEIKLQALNTLPGLGQMTWNNSFFQQNIEEKK